MSSATARSEKRAAAAPAYTSATLAAAVNNSPYTIREGKAVIQRPPKQNGAEQGKDKAAAEGEEAAAAEDTEMSDDAAAAAGVSSGEGGPPSSIEVIEGEGQQEVFYNKVQVFNRDLSIVCIQTFIDTRSDEHADRAQAQKEKEKRRAAVKAQMAATEAAAASSGTAASAAPAESAAAAATESASADADSFPGIQILEALSATGLRSIRYFRELSGVRSIIVNDMDAEAVRSIEHNIALNGLTTAQLIPSHSDAITLMQKFRPPVVGRGLERPQVIDLDPYGTASPFLDSAVQAVDEGGLLAVTCTDKAILCGNHSEACFAKYGSMPLKGAACHELAVRIVLNSIATACHRYGRYMVPMLSMSIDFYVRVFVRVYTSPMLVKRQAAQCGMLLSCTGCQSFWPHAIGRVKVDGNSVKYSPGLLDAPLQAGCRCPQCDSSIKMGGPFWLGKLHDKSFVARALARVQKDPSLWATSGRIIGSLTVAGEELQPGEEVTPEPKMSAKAAEAYAAAQQASAAAAAPAAGEAAAPAAAPAAPAAPVLERASPILYYSLPVLFQTVNSSCPKISHVRSALRNAGYSVSQSHSHSSAIKTDAPPQVVWDVVRCALQADPPKNGQKKGTAGERLMLRKPAFAHDFTYVPGTDMSSSATGVAKFLPNPEEHWGPKAKAGKRKVEQSAEPSKRAKTNQNKRSRYRACKTFAANGSCPYGDNCKYAHVVGAKPGEDVTQRVAEMEAAAAAAKETPVPAP